MKIALLNHNFIEQGTYFRCFNFARYLVKRGHHVTLLTIAGSKQYLLKKEFRQGVKIIQLPKGIISKIRNEWEPLDILIRTGHMLACPYDVIIAFEHFVNVSFPFYFCQWFNKPATFIADWADWWCDGGLLESGRDKGWGIEYKMERFLEKDIKRRADGVTTTSTALYQRALDIGVPKEKLCYIPSGADVEGIQPLPKEKMRKELGLSENDKIIQWVGSGVGADLHLMFPIFREVIEEMGEVKFMIVGPKDPRRECLIERFRLAGKIIETGRVPYPDLPKYLACADIFVLLLSDTINNRARGPIKLGDYMAAGRPTVVNDIGDAGIWFREDKLGLLAKSDMSDFAHKIIELLENPDLCERIGENARRIAQDKYSWAIMAERLEKFIHNLGQLHYLDSCGKSS